MKTRKERNKLRELLVEKAMENSIKDCFSIDPHYEAKQKEQEINLFKDFIIERIVKSDGKDFWALEKANYFNIEIPSPEKMIELKTQYDLKYKLDIQNLKEYIQEEYKDELAGD